VIKSVTYRVRRVSSAANVPCRMYVRELERKFLKTHFAIKQ